MQKSRDPKNRNPFEEKTILLTFILVSLFFLYMIRMFILPVFVAAILTAVTWPLFKKIRNKVRVNWVSSLITLFILTILVLAPVMFMAIAAYREAAQLFDNIHLRELSRILQIKINYLLVNPPSWLIKLGGLTGIPFQDIDVHAKFMELSQSSRHLVGYLFSGGTALSKSLVSSTTSIIITLFSMFYFYGDGERILSRIIRLFPLDDRDEKEILVEMTSTTRATLKGALLIGFIQGVLGGLSLWLAGIPSPVFWTVVMVILSLIPSVGTAVILIPAAAILVFTGNIPWGIFVAVSAVIISILDNILRPRLVGKDLKMHDLMILFSTIGGIGMFGLPGFILGPVTASMFMSFLRIYGKTYANEPALPAATPESHPPHRASGPARPARRNPGRRIPKKET